MSEPEAIQISVRVLTKIKAINQMEMRNTDVSLVNITRIIRLISVAVLKTMVGTRLSGSNLTMSDNSLVCLDLGEVSGFFFILFQ